MGGAASPAITRVGRLTEHLRRPLTGEQALAENCGGRNSVYQDLRAGESVAHSFHCSNAAWVSAACKGGHGERRPQRDAEPGHAGCGMPG